jgi:hypothetical protein
MKNFAIQTMMIAAAAGVLTMATASAQNLTADVPFTFRAAKTQLKPGHYVIEPIEIGAGTMYKVQNVATGEGTFIHALTEPQPNLNKGAAKLVFRCGAEECSLAEFWTPTGGRHELPRPYMRRVPVTEASLRVIPATIQ